MVKRVLDFLFSGILILVASPIFLIAFLLVRLDGGPVFYRQWRAGRQGKPFELLKFRSMRVNNLPLAEVGQVTSSHPLVTPVGRWLRRLKIDELPQLWNVLRGDMALIGPRPVPPEHVAGYSPFARRRLEVRPGMTGWAQVNGNAEITWDERIALDVWYVDHRSFWLDLKILFLTFSVIFRGEIPHREAIEQAHEYANSAGRRS